MTDRAPRPEGMSEERLAEIRANVLNEDADRCTFWCDANDLLIEWDRLRADGATLKVRADEALAAHSASFGALQTLSAALFDGEVDDYAALAEKVIARVRQLEADRATLRERVDTLERGLRVIGSVIGARELTDGTKVRSIAIIVKDNLPASASNELAREQEKARAASPWQPIETAPKDGTDILIAFVFIGVTQVRYYQTEACWISSWNGERVSNDKAAGWQPLPAPPAQDGGLT